MNKKYEGKSCPFCKSPFLETDEIVECDACEIPHHKDCWIENGQCTTFGCTGKMKGAATDEGDVAQQAPPIPSMNQVPPVAAQAQAGQINQTPKFCIRCGSKLIPGDLFCRGCGNRIQAAAAPISPEEHNKRQYDQAVNLLEASRFDEALQIFTKLADYSDSAEKAKLCVQGKENAQKENLYVNAVSVLKKQKVSDTEIKKSIEALSSISEYKDSKAKIADLEKMLEKWHEAKKSAEEAALKRRYYVAVSYLGSGLYDEAVEIFTELGDYSDCKDQIKKITETRETERKEGIYTKALAILTDKSVTDTEIKESIEALKSIEDYKDSKEKVSELEAHLEKWYEDKAAAEEAERIRKAKAKAKAKKITLISILSTMLVAIIVVGVVFVTKVYNIAYNLDGGAFEGESKNSYTLLTDDMMLVAPVKEGYTFTGWTGTDVDTPTLNVTISKWSVGHREYTANWQANDYKITFDNAGGEGAESQNVTFDSTIILPTPTKEGYTFNGWYAGSQEYLSGSCWKDASDITLTAKWTANSYNITFENTQEVIPEVVVTYNPNYSGASLTKITLKNGLKLPDPAIPTRTGYVFTGWYTNSSCTTEYTFSGNITSDMTLYAGWQEITITNNSTNAWISSGGILASTNKAHNSNSTYKITASSAVTVSFSYKTSSESGYDYLYIKKNGSILKSCSGSTSYVEYSVELKSGDYLEFVYYKDGTGSSGSDCAYIADLTFTSFEPYTSKAVAKISSEKTYEYKSGSKISQTVTFDTEISLIVATRRGYSFLGWYDGDTKVESGIWKFANDVTLTAKWEAGGNTIVLDANGGTVSSDSVAVTFDKAFTLPTPTRTGYTFGGWFVGTKQYVDGVWNETEDVTLVAKWIANVYDVTYSDISEVVSGISVTFDYNYSGSTPSVVELENEDVLSYPTVPTRSGYAFAGWYTDSSCTTEYTFSGSITEDITLYAKWIAMSTTTQTREYFDVVSYTSSSSKKTVVASSYSDYNYYYFTCYTTGSYKIYEYWGAGDFYFNVTNVTTGVSISSKNLYGGNTSATISFNANAGDVICISTKRYSSSYNYTSNGTFYVMGASYPTSTAIASCDDEDGYIYTEDSTVSVTVIYGEEITLPTPTRTRYTFLGWYNGETKVESGDWSIASDVTLVPMWEAIKTTITLNANGGSVSSTSMNVAYGDEVTLPTPTRTGYTFEGWFVGTTEYESGTWEEVSDLTLVAKWTANEYTVTYSDVSKTANKVSVTFNYNYSGSTSTVVKLSNGDVLSYPTVPTRSGYAFAGWYTNSSCTTAYSFSGSITEDITLYAKWVAMSTTTNTREYFDVASYTSSSSKKTVVASSYSDYNYYYFTCYTTGSYKIYEYWGTGDFYFNVTNVTTGVSISGINLYGGNTSATISFNANAGDVICISTKRYSASFNYTSSGTFYVTGVSYPTSTATASCEVDAFIYTEDSTASVTVTYGEEITLPTPTRTGYTFEGWFVGTTEYESGIWEEVSDVTLVAKWTVNEIELPIEIPLPSEWE